MPDKPFSLVDLSGVSEPLTKLIETVSSGVGMLYEPTRVERKARAEARAAIILANSKAEVQEINLRASERLVNRELRRQENIESIVKVAAESLPEEVSTEPVNEDWVAQFFDYSQDVSNEQMQTVWARILAGEIAKPNSFSPRTLHLVRHLRQAEAAEFRTLCAFIFNGRINLRSDAIDAYMKTFGLNVVAMKNLEKIGLVTTDLSGPYDAFEGEGMSFIYFGKQYQLRNLPSGEDKSFRSGVIVHLLTPEGRELNSVAGAEPDIKYIELLEATLKEKQFIFELRG